MQQLLLGIGNAI